MATSTPGRHARTVGRMLIIPNTVGAGTPAADAYSDRGVWEIGPIMSLITPEKQVIFISVRVMTAGAGEFVVKGPTGSQGAQFCVYRVQAEIPGENIVAVGIAFARTSTSMG